MERTQSWVENDQINPKTGKKDRSHQDHVGLLTGVWKYEILTQERNELCFASFGIFELLADDSYSAPWAVHVKSNQFVFN